MIWEDKRQIFLQDFDDCRAWSNSSTPWTVAPSNVHNSLLHHLQYRREMPAGPAHELGFECWSVWTIKWSGWKAPISLTWKSDVNIFITHNVSIKTIIGRSDCCERCKLRNLSNMHKESQTLTNQKPQFGITFLRLLSIILTFDSQLCRCGLQKMRQQNCICVFTFWICGMHAAKKTRERSEGKNAPTRSISCGEDLNWPLLSG